MASASDYHGMGEQVRLGRQQQPASAGAEGRVTGVPSGDDASWTGWGDVEEKPQEKPGLKKKLGVSKAAPSAAPAAAAAAPKATPEAGAGFSGFPADKGQLDDWLDDEWIDSK